MWCMKDLEVEGEGSVDGAGSYSWRLRIPSWNLRILNDPNKRVNVTGEVKRMGEELVFSRKKNRAHNRGNCEKYVRREIG